MAFSGTIADWSFADILQVVSAQQKSGTLVLEHLDSSIIFSFAEGRIVDVEQHDPARQSGFVRFLVDTGRLTPPTARKIVGLCHERQQHAMTVLHDSGVLEPESLSDAITDYLQEIIFDVLQWDEGDYEFTAHDVIPHPALPVLGTEGVLLEGMRRIDEWARISEIVQPDTVFVRADGVPLPAELPRHGRALLKLIDSIQDVQALGRQVPLTEYALGETLWTLHQAGLILVSSEAHLPEEILELDVDDLEPTARGEQLLRVLSLVLLVAASVCFGVVTHGHDWLAGGSDGYAMRDAQALRFALELYRAEQGVFPATLDELETIGMRVPPAARGLVYRTQDDGDAYTLIRAAAAPPLDLTAQLGALRGRLTAELP